jgi:hypothetical protein
VWVVFARRPRLADHQAYAAEARQRLLEADIENWLQSRSDRPVPAPVGAPVPVDEAALRRLPILTTGSSGVIYGLR